MIAMVTKVTIHFLVTFVTKITNIPMVTFAIILTNVSKVHWLLWLHERARSFFFLLIFRILFLSVFNTFYTHPLICYLFALRSCNCVIAFRFLIN